MTDGILIGGSDAGEAFMKSMARAAGSSLVRKLFRGILGSLLK
jgi:hypothetical protein